MKIISFINKQRKKIFTGFSVLVFILLFFSFALPVIIRPIAEKQITKLISREVKISKIRLNPMALSIQIDSVTIKEIGSKDTFAAFDKLYINLE